MQKFSVIFKQFLYIWIKHLLNLLAVKFHLQSFMEVTGVNGGGHSAAAGACLSTLYCYAQVQSHFADTEHVVAP